MKAEHSGPKYFKKPSLMNTVYIRDEAINTEGLFRVVVKHDMEHILLYFLKASMGFTGKKNGYILLQSPTWD